MKIHEHVSSHHSFMYLWIIGAVLVLGGLMYSYIGTHPDGIIDGKHEGDVRTTIAQFGNALSHVSLLSPTVAEDIQSAYAPYVSEELLASWVLHPETAPGRTVSSPWPSHIEVDTVSMNNSGAYDVLGRVMLLTSTGDAGFIPVSLTVSDVGGSFLITRYEENPGVTRPQESSVTVTATIDETVIVFDTMLTPTELLEDSRCPLDVVCVQAGQARVSVDLVTDMGTSTMSITLNSKEPITTETISFWLIEAEPYPIEGSSAEESDYRFTFRIEKR